MYPGSPKPNIPRVLESELNAKIAGYVQLAQKCLQKENITNQNSYTHCGLESQQVVKNTSRQLRLQC